MLGQMMGAILAFTGLTGLTMVSAIDLAQQKFLSSMVMGADSGGGTGMTNKPEVRWGTNATHIEVQLAYPSLGWIALGLSPNGGMDQSDVLFGYVDDRTKEVVVQDRFIIVDAASMNVNLSLDAQQDWTRVSGSQNNSYTIIRAVRKLRTCDTFDRPIKSAGMPVIFSYNMKDPQSKTGPIQMHNQRGSSNVNFLRTTPPPAAKEPIAMVLNFTMGNFQIPGDEITEYYCKITKLPTFTKKYHAVSENPIIDPRNVDLLHHLLLYRCGDNLPEEMKTDQQFACGPGSVAKTMNFCQVNIGGWATGGEGSSYPAEAGLPFTPAMSGTYILLQTHYNNPKLRTGVDNSGMSFALTDRLRKYDIGFLMTGTFNLDYVFALPPGEEAFRISTQCSDKCTSGLPKDGVNVVSAFVHMHTRGRIGVARHFRGNQELPPLIQDMNYDYNFQTPYALNPSHKLMPGDRIVTECTFNTAEEQDFVFGGEGTSQEMCLGFFSYYPDTGLSTCGVRYNLPGYLNAIGFPAKTLANGLVPRKPGQGLMDAITAGKFDVVDKLAQPVTDFMKRKYWDETQLDKLKEFYRSKQYTAVCNIAGTWTMVDQDYPPFIEPLTDFSEYEC